MSSNAKVRCHEKRNENRTGKENQQEVTPYVRARNAARSSPPRTSKMV